MSNLVKSNNNLFNLGQLGGDRFNFPSLSYFWKDFDSLFVGAFDENTATQIYETDNEYVFEYRKPGIPQDKWDIEVKNDRLFVRADNTVENEEKDENKKFYRKQTSSVSINESYTLPSNTDQNNVQAKYQDGVLKITIPKVETNEDPPNKIEVQS